jgi:hypothetical protein
MNVISVVLIKRNNTNFKKTRNAPSKKILLYPFFVPSWLAASLAFGATTSLRASQFSFFDSIRVGKKQIT